MIVWMEYKCNLAGRTYKFVECEECKQKYVYGMVRKATGQGDSLYFLDNAGAQNRARNSAQAQLEKALANDCDPVPCPKCGSYQDDMVEKLCREYRMWMWWLGIFAIFAGVLCGALGYAFHGTDSRALGMGLLATGFVGIAAGIGSMVLRRHMADAFEPNRTPLQQRLAIAEDRAEKVKSFKAWCKAMGAQADDKIVEG